MRERKRERELGREGRVRLEREGESVNKGGTASLEGEREKGSRV